MALHTPTHPASHVEHHVLRNTLLFVGLVAFAMAVLLVLMLVKPVAAPSTVSATEPQALVEFRAAERADRANPVVTQARRWSSSGRPSAARS